MTSCDMTLRELRQMIARGEVSSREIVTAALHRIEAVDKAIGAYIAVDAEGALAAADAADRAIEEARRNGRIDTIGPLTGIPIALKDNICTKGIRTTAGSRMLESFVPPYSASVAQRLTDAGAIIVGKANLDEFAMGSTTESSAFHSTRNPWDTSRVPGGSSGGAVAAVAAGMACAAVGTDTGGSVRQPASFCGVVGFKPTYGRVSRYGVVGFGSSLDCIGPITRDVRDSAIMLGAMAGQDRMDSTSSPEPVPDYLTYVGEDIRGLRIGVPQEFFAAGLDAGVRTAVERALHALESSGAELVGVNIPHVEYSLAVYYLVATAEASSNLSRFDGIRYGHRAHGAGDVGSTIAASRAEGFGAEVKRRIMLGTLALSAGNYDAYYDKAMRVRTLIRNDIQQVLKQCDCFVSPTAPTTAFKIGEMVEDPLTMYLQDIYTIVANLAGVPAISVPCGLSEGLPVGLQLFGHMFGEGTLLQVASAVEDSVGKAVGRPGLGVSRS